MEIQEQKKMFETVIGIMKIRILEVLSELKKGYGARKKIISIETGIDINILTVLLKQLKQEGKIELICIFCEENGTPNRSGYCIKGNLIY